MGIYLYDIENRLIEHGDVEDRLAWYIHGEAKEQTFIRLFGEQLNIITNPEKYTNPAAIDLYQPETRQLIDLKTANTPFFTSERNYGIPPRFAVTLNQIDVERYQNLYPDMTLYFWVDWIAIRYVSTSARYGNTEIIIDPLHGVWSISLQQVLTIIQNERPPLHPYGNRRNDQRGNARYSYVLDLRHPSFEQLL